MNLLNQTKYSKKATIEGLIKPMVETEDFMAGTEGTRKVRPSYGVKDGELIAKYTVPNHILQGRPTNAEIDANTVVPFGNPTLSTSKWALKQDFIFQRYHSDILTSGIEDNSENKDARPNAVGAAIMNNLLKATSAAFSLDLINTAFWSHTTFDPDTTDAGHTFPDKTIDNYKKGDGFMKQLKTATTASKFSNQTITAGTALTAATANTLAGAMIDNADRKLRNYGRNLPSGFRPFFLLSDQFYYALQSYVSDTFNGVPAGYMIFSTGKDGLQTQKGFLFRGYEVYNADFFTDQYFETLAAADTKNHMGIFTIPENLNLGFNLNNPGILGGSDGGLVLTPRLDPEKGGATDVALYLEYDYKIADDTMFSTAGIEQAP